MDARRPSGAPIRQSLAYPHGRVAYVAALIVLVCAAVLGLIGIQRDSTNGAAAGGISHSPHSSGSATKTPTPVRPHEAHVADERGDTTGPDLLSLSASATRAVLRVRLTLAAPVADDVTLRVFIDADSDRTTGSLSFPCAAATLGADYEIVTAGDRIDQFRTSAGNGCGAPFTTAKAAGLTIRAEGERVSLAIPTRDVRRAGEHLIGLYVQALRTTGGQIDSCPGQHDQPVSVQY